MRQYGEITSALLFRSLVVQNKGVIPLGRVAKDVFVLYRLQKNGLAIVSVAKKVCDDADVFSRAIVDKATDMCSDITLGKTVCVTSAKNEDTSLLKAYFDTAPFILSMPFVKAIAGIFKETKFEVTYAKPCISVTAIGDDKFKIASGEQGFQYIMKPGCNKACVLREYAVFSGVLDVEKEPVEFKDVKPELEKYVEEALVYVKEHVEESDKVKYSLNDLITKLNNENKRVCVQRYDMGVSEYRLKDLRAEKKSESTLEFKSMLSSYFERKIPAFVDTYEEKSSNQSDENLYFDCYARDTEISEFNCKLRLFETYIGYMLSSEDMLYNADFENDIIELVMLLISPILVPFKDANYEISEYTKNIIGEIAKGLEGVCVFSLGISGVKDIRNILLHYTKLALKSWESIG